MLSPAMTKADNLLAQGRYADAHPLLLQQLRSKPNDALAHEWMAAALLFTARPDVALFHAQRALALEPHADATTQGRRHELAANIFGALTKPAEALAHARKAVELSPTAQALNVLAAVNLMGDNKAGALEPATRAYALEPAEPTIALNYAGVLAEIGKPEESVRITMGAMNAGNQADPVFTERITTLLHYTTPLGPTTPFNASATDADIIDPTVKLAWTKRWSSHVTAVQKSLGAKPLTRVRDFAATRPLRIAFMSADFRSHSCAFFLRPLLKHLPRDRFHVTAVHISARKDAVTQELAALCDAFVHAPTWTAQSLAQKIADHNIDILIECGGFTTGSGIAACCWQPAPVQLSYLGYPAGTAMQTINARIVDTLTDPPGTSDAHCAEPLLRTPGCFVCFDPGPDIPPLATRTPTNHITFGSFSATSKFSRATYDMWSAVLREVPNSRMLIKGALFDEPAARNAVHAEFAQRSIPHDRIELVGRLANPRDHLNLYSRVDIALDTYPYVGTTTICESLLMGVPIISRAGNQHVSRVGVSLLTHAECPELIAKDASDFTRIATQLAHDDTRRATYHATLRDKLLTSPVCQATSFAQYFGELLSTAWRTSPR